MGISFRERSGGEDGEAFPTKGRCASATFGRIGIDGPGAVDMCRGGELCQEERSSGRAVVRGRLAAGKQPSRSYREAVSFNGRLRASPGAVRGKGSIMTIFGR